MFIYMKRSSKNYYVKNENIKIFTVSNNFNGEVKANCPQPQPKSYS